MVPMRKKTKIERARQYLKTGGVLREDSDDELGTEDFPWEWIFENDHHEDGIESTPKKRSASRALDESAIIGARMGKFECFLGDCVLLKGEGSEAWVGIATHFFTDEETEDKMVNLMWFSTPREIRNKVKVRNDALEVRVNVRSLDLSLIVCRMKSISRRPGTIIRWSQSMERRSSCLQKHSLKHIQLDLCLANLLNTGRSSFAVGAATQEPPHTPKSLSGKISTRALSIYTTLRTSSTHKRNPHGKKRLA